MIRLRLVDPAALFQSVSDATRLRLLRLLHRQELNVRELVRVTGLSQPRVSKHLAVLRDQGWLEHRREGTWSWYRTVRAADFAAGATLFRQVTAAADGVPEADADDHALAVVLADRRVRDRGFFSSLAERWDEIRGEYEHSDIRLGAVSALVAEGVTVLDVGTGTGAMLPVFAAAATTVVAVDNSEAMLARARATCLREDLRNVRLCHADLAELPFAEGSFDACHCAMALHHVEDPAAAVAEMARVVRPGGTVSLAAFLPHEQHWMRDELAHHRLGFARAEIERYLGGCGLEPRAYLVRGKRRAAPLAARAEAAESGLDWPDVFLATALKPAAAVRGS